ncbi:protein of unknown function (plasmid) [Cupriavidus taiwanensis]|uniref:Uncharacterized protein n=2 Tax=Cupriavidus taiwanensis TaxID=164546 RepID=A0A375IMU0_9BURK|nr:hypothetical protein CBM2608_B100053 [Cupriavidus taiwanensis]SPA36630.1 hypothetical protein CBM2623_B90055 [Cupriavidus taiwanensis]SPK74792.1 protein of unknown function [Cupriavidus taiwanensis]
MALLPSSLHLPAPVPAGALCGGIGMPRCQQCPVFPSCSFSPARDFCTAVVAVAAAGAGAAPPVRNMHRFGRLLKKGGAMSTIEESIDVRVPVQVAYQQWCRFEEFPRFMEGVEEVAIPVCPCRQSNQHWQGRIQRNCPCLPSPCPATLCKTKRPHCARSIGT